MMVVVVRKIVACIYALFPFFSPQSSLSLSPSPSAFHHTHNTHQHPPTRQRPPNPRQHLRHRLVPRQHEPEAVHLLQHGAAAGLYLWLCLCMCIYEGWEAVYGWVRKKGEGHGMVYTHTHLYIPTPTHSNHARTVSRTLISPWPGPPSGTASPSRIKATAACSACFVFILDVRMCVCEDG